jgi:Ca2+:H+ antiporter
MSFVRSMRPWWAIAAPLVAWLLYSVAHGGSDHGLGLTALFAAALVGAVLAAVHHAEVVAHRIGEPLGTLVLAISITIIEVALIFSVMLAGGPKMAVLARDTVFASVMIILSGIVGLCLVVGGLRHHEQNFGKDGVGVSLAAIAVIVVMALVLPNHTVTEFGPAYSTGQLGFIAAVSVVLYLTFVLFQSVSHRGYFLPVGAAVDAEAHAEQPTDRAAWFSLVLLLASLAVVVSLAESLAPYIGRGVAAIGAPKALVGVIIAAVVLMPEGLAALRAAHANRLQTSLNLALGSALASIGLTIPTVALLSMLTGQTLTLGIDPKATVLLTLTLFVSGLSLSTGRTTVLQGMALLSIFAAYLFLTVVP